MRKKKDLFPDVSLAVAMDVEHFSSLHVATNKRKRLSNGKRKMERVEMQTLSIISNEEGTATEGVEGSNPVQTSLIMTAEAAKALSPQPPQFLLGATFPSSPDLENAVYPSSLGADHHDIKRRRSLPPNNNMPEPCCTALAVSSTPKAATCGLQTGLMLRDNVCTSRLLHNQEASCSERQCQEVDECLLSGGLKAGRAFPLGEVSDNMTHEEAEMDRLAKQNKELSDSLAEMTLRCKSLFIQNVALQKKVEILSDAVKDAEQIAVRANQHANDNAMKINSLTSRHLDTALNGLEDAGDTAQDKALCMIDREV
ncbi:hypothetical protein CEUSTIGMA_g3782.t1 [Chlamydomonas eustigma]|uniref:Uncharacterized protein n=1 Tax=Chlamydomonas eustigma TaxID=1157962 RepID=A0A250WZW8_9CHLO|nr:hypothetical protein CEUSTIGMA_g3782.t1 [Chlamydomonas eustigma]|eukprot:GAX76336.1 hypothetical protein CEUSTIGMA_g3782.t1 [Chlamydomonas eustigma]